MIPSGDRLIISGVPFDLPIAIVEGETYVLQGDEFLLIAEDSRVIARVPPPASSIFLKLKTMYRAVDAEEATDQERSFDMDLSTLTPRLLEVAEGKIWFGYSFYGGEGSVGYGGIGFFDPRTAQIGVLRVPALSTCQADSLLITRDQIYVLTSYAGELSAFACNGLVAVDRSSGATRAWLPPGSGVIWNKDGEQDPLTQAAYLKPIDEIVREQKWISHRVPSFDERTMERIRSVGIETFMCETTRGEDQIVTEAHASGEVVLDTEVVFSHQPEARPIFGDKGGPVGGVMLSDSSSTGLGYYEVDEATFLVWGDTLQLRKAILSHPHQYIPGGNLVFPVGVSGDTHRLRGLRSRLWWVTLLEASPRQYRFRVRITKPGHTSLD